MSNTTQEWGQLSFHWASGIKKIVLIQQGDDAFVYDDLSFSNVPVPELGTFLLFGSGVFGIVFRFLKSRK